MGSDALVPSSNPAAAVRVSRGAAVPHDAEIAVVVMAINGDRRVADAVASLRAEPGPIEIIVVNSGEGSVKGALGAHRDHLVVVEADALRLPGGTRNLGIVNSTAGIVAFLAADCRATPGWIEARLAAHRCAAAVASALRPTPGEDGKIASVSWAVHALLHTRRAPEYPAATAARYGASYARDLFEQYGLFAEDLRIGEDTEFNKRVAATAPLAWGPQIVTLHAYPTRLGPALADAYDRGFELYRWNRERNRRPLWLSVRRALGNWQVARGLAPLTSGDVRRALRRASPLLLLLASAYACGAIGTAARHWFARLSRRDSSA